jgi:hypothetical protein
MSRAFSEIIWIFTGDFGMLGKTIFRLQPNAPQKVMVASQPAHNRRLKKMTTGACNSRV